MSKKNVIFHTTVAFFRSTLQLFAVWLITSSIFWGIEHMHFSWCVGNGFSGFVRSLITNQSPMCSALRKISNHMSSAGTNALYIFTGGFGLKVLGFLSTKLGHHNANANAENNPETNQPQSPEPASSVSSAT